MALAAVIDLWVRMWYKSRRSDSFCEILNIYCEKEVLFPGVGCKLKFFGCPSIISQCLLKLLKKRKREKVNQKEGKIAIHKASLGSRGKGHCDEPSHWTSENGRGTQGIMLLLRKKEGSGSEQAEAHLHSRWAQLGRPSWSVPEVIQLGPVAKRSQMHHPRALCLSLPPSFFSPYTFISVKVSFWFLSLATHKVLNNTSFSHEWFFRPRGFQKLLLKIRIALTLCIVNM